LPAASVAVARKVVLVSAPTEAVMPGDANVVALPVATGLPLQSDVAYRRTVAPAAAVPLTSGLLSLAGESGSVSVSVGSPGAVESST
jgi:hypothetical protein